MNQLITEDQARQITGGRKPLVPIEYERACKDLVLCQTIDEAKYFSDKADALAAWAKIYQSDEAGLEARRLKLHAYRRMGELAHELRPNRDRKNTNDHRGPKSVLMETGLSKKRAEAAVTASRVDPEKFNEMVNSPRAPAPSALTWKSKPGWSKFYRESGLGVLRSFSQSNSARAVAATIDPGDAAKVRLTMHEVIDWLEEMQGCFPAQNEGSK